MLPDIFSPWGTKAAFLLTSARQEIIFSTTLFLLVWLITRFLRRLPVLQYGLWSLVLLRLVLPTDLAHPFAVGNVLAYFSFFDASAVATAQQEELATLTTTVMPTWWDEHLATTTPTKNTPHSGNPTVQALLFLLWFVGLLGFAGIFLNRLLYYRAIVRQAEPAMGNDLAAVANAWRNYFAIRRAVKLVTSDRALSPFTLGIFRPVIFLPGTLIDAADHETLDAIIGHEMAHIKRHDDLWIKLQGAIQLLYFFNPVVWFTNRKIIEAREQICDTMVLARGSITPSAYGKSMLAVLKLNLVGSDGVAFASAFGNHRKRFVARLQNILTIRTVQPLRARSFMLVTGVVGLLVLPMAGMQKSPQAKPFAEPALFSAQHEPAAEERTESVAAAVVPRGPAVAPLPQDNLRELKNPVPAGKVSAPYGDFKDPYTGKVKFHRAIDIRAPLRTKIFAPAAGVVDSIATTFQKGSGMGKYIVLDHGDGLVTTFAHLDTVLVAQQQKVAAGEVIGLVGSTGRATGPHLHFEVWHNGKTENPSKYVREWGKGRGEKK